MIFKLWRHPERNIYGLFLLVCLLCLSLQGLGFSVLLEYSRAGIEQGELWLLITGHMVHLSWSHFWMNMAGLLLGAVFFGSYYSAGVWSGLMLFSALFCSLGLYLFNPELMHYVGMSGVLHSLLVAGAVKEYRHYRKSGLMLFVLLGAKLIWEQLSGALPGSETMSGGYVVVDAHLYGAIAGLIFVLGHQLIHVHNRHQDRQHNQ